MAGRSTDRREEQQQRRPPRRQLGHPAHLPTPAGHHRCTLPPAASRQCAAAVHAVCSFSLHDSKRHTQLQLPDGLPPVPPLSPPAPHSSALPCLHSLQAATAKDRPQATQRRRRTAGATSAAAAAAQEAVQEAGGPAAPVLDSAAAAAAAAGTAGASTAGGAVAGAQRPTQVCCVTFSLQGDQSCIMQCMMLSKGCVPSGQVASAATE